MAATCSDVFVALTFRISGRILLAVLPMAHPMVSMIVLETRSLASGYDKMYLSYELEGYPESSPEFGWCLGGKRQKQRECSTRVISILALPRCEQPTVVIKRFMRNIENVAGELSAGELT